MKVRVEILTVICGVKQLEIEVVMKLFHVYLNILLKSILKEVLNNYFYFVVLKHNKNRAMFSMLYYNLKYNFSIKKHLKIIFLLWDHTYVPMDSVLVIIEKFMNKKQFGHLASGLHWSKIYV